jgi:hypothetical protein
MFALLLLFRKTGARCGPRAAGVAASNTRPDDDFTRRFPLIAMATAKPNRIGANERYG